MTKNPKKKILFATNNPGKLFEFKQAFYKNNNQYEIISYVDLPYEVPECKEDGLSFQENALLKATNASNNLGEAKKGLIIVADDSGMEIACLNNEPGVFTRRWAGYRMTDDEIVNYCLSRMLNQKNRSAVYVNCFAVLLPNGVKKIVYGRSSGTILEEPNERSRLPGMPFRSLFFVPELNMMFHEVRELDARDRCGYALGHEEAVQGVIEYLDNRMLC